MSAHNFIPFHSCRADQAGSANTGRTRRTLLLLTCLATSGVILAPVEEESVCRLLRNPSAPNPPTSGNILSYFQCQGACPGGQPAPACLMKAWERGPVVNYSCWCGGDMPPAPCKGSVEMSWNPSTQRAAFNGPWCETKLCANDCTVNSSGTEVCKCP